MQYIIKAMFVHFKLCVEMNKFLFSISNYVTLLMSVISFSLLACD